MANQTWNLDCPAVLHVEVSAAPKSSFWTFDESVKSKIQDAIETSVLTLGVPPIALDDMTIQVEGVSVLPLIQGDPFTDRDRLIGRMNHLVRLICHAEADVDWLGNVQQTVPQEVFGKLVEHVNGAVELLKSFGLSADENQWPDSSKD